MSRITNPTRIPHRPFHVLPEGYDVAVVHAEWFYHGVVDITSLRETLPNTYIRVNSGMRVVGLPTLFVHKRVAEWFSDDAVNGYFQLMSDYPAGLKSTQGPLVEKFEDGEFMAVSRGWDAESGDYFAIPLTHIGVPFPGVSYMALCPRASVEASEAFLHTGDASGLPIPRAHL